MVMAFRKVEICVFHVDSYKVFPLFLNDSARPVTIDIPHR